MRSVKYIVLIVCICVVQALSAQSDTSKFSMKSLVAYNLNPGISFGLGGGRPRGYLPQPTIKLGRFELGYSPPYDNMSYTMSGFQLDLDVYRFNGVQGKPANATVALGLSLQENIRQSISTEINRVSFLGGVNQYVGKRSQFSVKIGALERYAFSYSGGYYSGDYKLVKDNLQWFPYGEIAYKVYALPFDKKQKLLRRLAKKEMKIDGKKVKNAFANWLNPYWSIGFGLDRALLATPSAGVRIGRLRLDASGIYIPEYTLSGAAKLTVDAIALKNAENRRQYITIGANVFGLGGYSSDFSIVGITSGMVFYKLSGRSSVEFNLGAGRWFSSYRDDPPIVEDEDYVDQSSSDRGFIPTAGVSYNIYLFKI